MTGILKVDQWKDSGDNALMTSDGAGNLTANVSLTSPGITLSDNILFNNASKGVYLGVTSATASNLLDDYEEGTWTPTFNGASGGDIRGQYIKVGNVVTCYGHGWGITSTAVSATVSNFPFSSPSGQTYISGTVGANTWTNNGASMWGYSANGVFIFDCVNKQEATAIAGSPKYFSFSITYHTA